MLVAQITGQRHSFLGKYKVGFSEEGRVLALYLQIYNNAGNSLDLSLLVLEHAMFHSDNIYEIQNIKIKGNVCFTNLPSNTAFRGFGGPQGMLITENWIEHISMCYPLLINPMSIIVFLINGLWAGLVIGFVTEYYTRNAYNPIQGVVHSCKTRAATNVIFGLALGYKSISFPIFSIAVSIFVSLVWLPCMVLQ
jgi:hypothetical protein